MIGYTMGTPEAMNHDPLPSLERYPDEPCRHDWVSTGRAVLDADGDEIREVCCTRCGEKDIV